MGTMKKMFVLFCAFLISFSVHAVPVLGMLRIPWSVIEQQLDEHPEYLSSTKTFPINDLAVASSFGPITLPPIDVLVKYNLNSIFFQDQNMPVSTRDLAIQIQIPAIAIQKQVSVKNGGVEVIVNLSASCSPIQLIQTRASIQALIQWRLQNQKINGIISNLNFQWPANSWMISQIQCSGPVGFADLIQKDLATKLNDATAFKDEVQGLLQNALNEHLNLFLNSALAPHFLALSNVNIEYQLNQVEKISGTGVDFQILVSDATADPKVQPIDDLKNTTLPELSADHISLAFGPLGFQELIRTSLLGQKYQVALKSFSGFAQLMRSRFFQFFIWPDLMNFPKSSNFTLHSQFLPTSTIALGANQQWNLNLDSSSWIEAPREGNQWHYLDIQNRVKAKLSIAIASGVLTLAPTIKSVKSQISFGQDYLDRFHPFTNLATWILDDAIKQNLALQSQSFQIPKLQMDGLDPFELEKFRVGQKNEMIFEFSALPGAL